ncbi:hypothetical protein K504DRAFT_301073 [Pleomassaria siparia CBS 279.74]|uniref:Uncharacterized protein n=1 Tax=Pleomassaria siparia CBS 279.74 TaxID=1314801 RepID=A0A6G1K5N9_9PLEO|nr:hypothetical protein K504DRAFT_301073 [Pleomassaria siparia CBS 279.74]
MPNLPYSHTTMANLGGGKHSQHHKLVYETPKRSHKSHRRQTSSTSEEAGNEDDDEEDSSTQEGDQEDDEDHEPDVLAPSHGLGKGKGKRPGIRIEPAGEDEFLQDRQEEHDEEETASRETGPTYSTHMGDQLLTPRNKKRTFSNLSNHSVLFGEQDDEELSFPRTKVPRKLSINGGRPLLAYKKDANGQNLLEYENAIESDDEEKSIDVDDEDYSGVNLISDDDESDMENVEQQEEHFIVSDEQQRANALFTDFFDARRLSLDSHASDNIFDVTAPLEENYLAGAINSDIGFGQFFEPQAVPTSPDAIAKRKYSDSSTKRVRFDDEVQVSESSSSSSSSDLDNSMFPDLFMDQDSIPASLYQLMENSNDHDNEDYDSPGSDRSFWDVGQDDSRSMKPQYTADFDESFDTDSSGYQTDMGDTTDDYESDFDLGSDAPPQTPTQKSVLRRPSSAPGSKAASPNPFQRSRPAAAGRTIVPPKRGYFFHKETTQAIAVTDRSTKTLTFYRPRTSASPWNSLPPTYSSSASTANNSPPASIQQFNLSESEVHTDMFSNPFTGDIMLTGIYGSAPANYDMFGGDSIGPPEAFYPFVNVGNNGNVIDDEIEDDFDDDEDFEDDVNLADFMDFGSDMDDTDAEQEEEVEVPATPATSMVAINGSTPAQPTPMVETPANRKRSTSDVMIKGMEHFDRGVVTAFRNNQNRHRDIACLPHDPDLRASVSRPIRSGRSAETLISPLRKRGATARKKIGSSPFAGVTKATSRLQNSVMKNHRGPPRMGTFS